MGQIIKFPLKQKLQADDFHSAIDELNYPDELKEQLRQDVYPYIEKYSKLIVTDPQMEIPSNLSEKDERLIVSQIKQLLLKQLSNTQHIMLQDIIKLASDKSKLKYNAKNI
ncbi:hypothetical protein ACU8V4_11130 [Pseudoalteromonas mariniglutinosa]